jgi:hypothetical protein
MLITCLKCAVAALVICLSSNDAGIPGPAGSIAREAAAVPLFEDDDPNEVLPPLCHNVTPVTVANCANSSSMCVTAVTPNYVCNLVIRSGDTVCRCVP